MACSNEPLSEEAQMMYIFRKMLEVQENGGCSFEYDEKIYDYTKLKLPSYTFTPIPDTSKTLVSTCP